MASKSGNSVLKEAAWVMVIVTAVFFAPPLLVLCTGGEVSIPLLLVAYGCIVAVVVISVLAAWRRVALRRAVMTEIARQYGLTYSDIDVENLPARYDIARMIRSHKSYKALRVINGPMLDGRIVCFDYGSDRILMGEIVCVGVFHAPARFKELGVGGKGAVHEAKVALGHPDITLESARFNERRRVECEDAEFAHQILHPRAMQWFLDRPQRLMYMNEDYFLVFDGLGFSSDPDDVEKMILDVKAFAQLLPDYLKRRE